MDRTEHSLIHVAQRVFDTPLAIDPRKWEVIVAALGPRLGVDPTNLAGMVINPENLDASQVSELSRLVSGQAIKPSAGRADSEDSDSEYSKKPYQVTDDGVAIISVCGTLVKKSSWMQAISGMTSYQSLGQQIQECMADANIRAVILDCDSPGGETHGLFDLCDLIYGLRGSKPIYAVANDAALSAAYAIASCADKIFVTRTGAVGSIGVFAGHIDQSGADKQAGLKFTYIHAGKKKVDGNPHEPLSSTAKADAQAEVDREYQMFVDLVSRNRSADADDIIATQAGVLFAESSIPLLADAVGTFEDCYLSLLDKSGIVIPESSNRVPADQVLLSRGKALKRIAMADRTTAPVITQIGGIGLDLLQSRISGLTSAQASTLHIELSSLKAQGDPMASELLLDLLAKKSDPADDEPEPEPKKGKKSEAKKASTSASESTDDMKECGACDGTGKDSDDETCETCHGSGEVPKESEAKKGKKAGKADDGEGADDGKKASVLKSLRTSATTSAKKSTPDPEPDPEDEDEDEEDEDESEPAPSKKKGLAAATATSNTMSQTDQVIQLCALAGVPDSKAMSWARKGLSVSQVRNKILDMRSSADRDPEQRMSSTFEGSGAISALDGIAKSATALLTTQGKNLIPAEFSDRFKGIHPAVAKGMLNAEAYNRVLTANPGAYAQYDDEKPTESAFQNKAAMRQYVTALSARIAQISGSGSEMILGRNAVSAPA